MQEIIVVLLTSSALTRGGVEALITKSGKPIRIANSFDDHTKLERYLKDERVDVLLIDEALSRPVDMGRFIKRMRDLHPGLAIIAMASRPIGSVIQRLMDRGATAFLHKEDDLETLLVDFIVAARRGVVALSPRASALLTLRRQKHERLSERDLDVLQLMATGFEVKEIARQFGVNNATIYRIQSTLRDALEARNNIQLIDVARKQKLIEDEN